MRIGVRLIPYNHRMRTARKEKRLTQSQLAELVGMKQGTISNIERMARKITEDEAVDIATILGYEVDDLFPLECRDTRIGSIDFVTEVDSLECIETRDVRMLALPDPSEPVGQAEVAEAIHSVLDKLRQREQLILKLRYGIGGGEPMTLEEVGKALGVTKERIRCIEAVALRHLRHPSRSRYLKDFW